MIKCDWSVCALFIALHTADEAGRMKMLTHRSLYAMRACTVFQPTRVYLGFYGTVTPCASNSARRAIAQACTGNFPSGAGRTKDTQARDR